MMRCHCSAKSRSTDVIGSALPAPDRSSCEVGKLFTLVIISASGGSRRHSASLLQYSLTSEVYSYRSLERSRSTNHHSPTMANISSSCPILLCPTELHTHILSFCDVQTLSRLSAVSPTFLELAGPRLYEHITITGLAQLQRLFYTEILSTSDSTKVNRFLSLDQTLTFTFVGAPEDRYPWAVIPGDQQDIDGEEEENASELFTSKRQFCSYPIEVHTLNAHFTNPGRDAEGVSRERIATQVASSFLNLFNPVCANLSSTNLLYVRLHAALWTSLKTLSVSELFWERLLSYTPILVGRDSDCVKIIVDLASPDEELAHYMERDLLRNLAGDAYEDDRPEDVLLAPEWPQVAEVEVKVRSNAQRDGFLGELRREWGPSAPGLMKLTISAQEQTRREAMICFIVV